MTTFKLRLLSALVLAVSLAALRMGLTHPQPRGALFWLVACGFTVQVIACTALLLTLRGNATNSGTGQQLMD